MKITEDMRQWLTVLRAVAHPYFYGAIARADFLVTFANPAYEYNITRASSSIPTAVMTEVPLVLTTDLLNKYDCLYGGSIHRRVADTDDCKALKNAIQLTDQERKTMREEIRRCKQLYLEEGQRALYRLIEHPFTGLEEDYQKSLELNKDCCKCFNSTTA
ncbi:hypothetical protein EON65_34845 [archaeon]|nr:MAG: hypothetical protein EON65_34845 [archaeon]